MGCQRKYKEQPDIITAYTTLIIVNYLPEVCLKSEYTTSNYVVVRQ